MNLEAIDPYRHYIKALEAVKRYAPNGAEYWQARDLQALLGYVAWEKFEAVIERARVACGSAGGTVSHHFHQSVNMITAGKGAQRPQSDWKLSRYACYLVAMNGDSNKHEVGYAQTYFAIQTRRQEVNDEQGRLTQRLRVIDANKHLKSAAARSGVERFPLFHDAGYRGLYGGRGLGEIKRYKGLAENEELLDRAGRSELAMNEFRITQTEEKLVREQVKGESNAINVHRQVGQQVRESVTRIGGTPPEDLRPEPSIKRLVSKHRKQVRQPATKRIS